MQPSDSTIYAVCIPGQKVRYEAKSCIVPIMGGSYNLSPEERELLRDEGYVFDDEGANFSPLNQYWGELSCIEWMTLNCRESNIGNAQYRRNWVEPNDEWYDEHTLYVPEPAVFGCSLERQFYGGHSAFDGPAITRELADTGSWLFTREQIDKLWAQNLFFGCNMARGPREKYNQFMGTLLDCLKPIWEKHQDHFLSIEGYDKRAMAFIAERIVTGMILYRDKLFPSIPIQTAPIAFIADD